MTACMYAVWVFSRVKSRCVMVGVGAFWNMYWFLEPAGRCVSPTSAIVWPGCVWLIVSTHLGCNSTRKYVPVVVHLHMSSVYVGGGTMVSMFIWAKTTPLVSGWSIASRMLIGRGSVSGVFPLRMCIRRFHMLARVAM